jgi:hypothetical protein
MKSAFNQKLSFSADPKYQCFYSQKMFDNKMTKDVFLPIFDKTALTNLLKCTFSNYYKKKNSCFSKII